MVPAPRLNRLLAGILGLVGAAALAAADASPGTLTLTEAKAEALRNHPAFVEAQLQALLARESLKETQAAYYPSATGFADAVDVGATNTRILAGGINNPSVYNRVAEGLQVSQLITDFGRTRNLSKGAKSRERAAAEDADASREEVLLNVEANFLATLQAQAVLRVADQTVETRRLLVNQVSALAKNQLKSELDVSFADVALGQAELLLQKAQGDAEGSEASLDAALGRKDTAPLVLVDTPQEAGTLPEVAPAVAAALARRPDLQALRFERDAASSAARAEKGANYPTLAAVAVLGNAFSEDSRLPDKYAAAAVQLNVPIFEGGADVARQHEAELRARMASEKLRDAEDTAVRDVRLALVAARTARQRQETTRQLLANANQALKLAQARYRVGSSSIVELSEAQLNQTTAAIADANAEFDVRLQAAVLDFQTGTLR